MKRLGANVLGVFIDVLDWPSVLDRISSWAAQRESRYVCLCNVHSVVTAAENATFWQVVNEADMATPDGAPIAWMLRRLGHVAQQRINGPDLMWRYCAEAQVFGEPIFFYGSTEETLSRLKVKLLKAFPNLIVAGAISPPFRPLQPSEDLAIVEQINASGAAVVFVSLGCPKQELWMEAHRGRIHAVMVGVGAAFDYHAGTIKRAPKWMQKMSLEWLYRLIQEPRRLWKRYFYTNTKFLILLMAEIVKVKIFKYNKSAK